VEVLAAYVDRGLDKDWLRQRFAQLHSLTDASRMEVIYAKASIR
jgi:hypothetical protein